MSLTRYCRYFLLFRVNRAVKYFNAPNPQDIWKWFRRPYQIHLISFSQNARLQNSNSNEIRSIKYGCTVSMLHVLQMDLVPFAAVYSSSIPLCCCCRWLLLFLLCINRFGTLHRILHTSISGSSSIHSLRSEIVHKFNFFFVSLLETSS